MMKLVVYAAAVFLFACVAQMMNDALYREQAAVAGARITVHNDPLPYTLFQDSHRGSGMLFFITVLGLMLGFAFVSASYAFTLVNEVATGLKRQEVRRQALY